MPGGMARRLTMAFTPSDKKAILYAPFCYPGLPTKDQVNDLRFGSVEGHASVDREKVSGWACRHEAGSDGHARTVKTFLIEQSPRDQCGARNWMSDLKNMIEAVKQGDRESVRAMLESDDRLANQRDESGATPLHYATLNGHRQIVQLLLERGADINSPDSQFGATPAGWAIEYLREVGGYLAIELDDLAYAIQLEDTRWVARFLKRFPSLRQASDTNGIPFQRLARESGNREIAGLFGLEEIP